MHRNTLPGDCRQPITTGMDRRFWPALLLSALAHILVFLVFRHPGQSSLIEAEKIEKGIEVSLQTLPAAKPVVKAPQPAPPPAPKPPRPAVKPVPKAKPLPKVQPAPKPPAPPRPRPPEIQPAPRPPAIPRPQPPEKTAEPKPPRPPKRQPQPAQEEAVPEFKDDFQQLSNTYSRDAPADKEAAAASSRAKPDTGVHPGAILNINPRIRYPLNAMRRGMQGVVVVLIHISTDGHTDGVDLLKSSGYEELDNQVLGAVQHWRFTPPRRGNTPVEGTYKHTVIFGADEEVTDSFATHWREVKLLPAK